MTTGGDEEMRARLTAVAPLLFGSGTCALIYQVAWLREMRLVFGVSTAASAAVLAIFMGGLGLGGALLGPRADDHPAPLLFYARLELMIAVSAAVTPLLVWLVRQVYIALGGSVAMGLGVATVVRLALASLVLGVPTLLMGGTLPAAGKAVETDADVRRRHVAVLYAANTLGAVTGAFLSTFVLLEVLGTRGTLWLACSLNTVVALLAWVQARRVPAAALQLATVSLATASPATVSPVTMPVAAFAPGAAAPAWFVLSAAAVVGFAFLLMELVWYRMFGPLLGGSSFTFGLILAVALLGIGLGGAAYALFDNGRPATLGGFAVSCTLEAMCIAYPYALGDRIAYFTMALRRLVALGFPGLVIGWTLVTAFVILPAAVVAGVQFPMLIGLLGTGRHKTGRHVGVAYAWNTVGAIAGSVAGGFGLLALLSATGCWRAVAGLLVALGVGAMVLSRRNEPRRSRLILPLAAAVATLLMLQTPGPTAAWRQSPIGAGREDIGTATMPNDFINWVNRRRRAVRWQADGVESSVGLDAQDSVTFLINGKSDGNARADAPTQVLGGLVPALVHPKPTRALVIGLGTGSTAGWLGSVPSIERVDVVELEPAVFEVARWCAPVNRNVLSNPKVHLFIGDAREVLLTTKERYDIIFSEPSNPYRAGVSSLFTREFYQTVASRLAEGGVFAQWLQAYEVDAKTVRTAYATLSSVFPAVETWQMEVSDLLLVSSLQPVTYDAVALAKRIAQEPFSTALAAVWRVNTLEGVLAHYVADASLAKLVAQMERTQNTDDRPAMEFAFARTVGRDGLFAISEIEEAAAARKVDRPQIGASSVDWTRVQDERVAWATAQEVPPKPLPNLNPEQLYRLNAQRLYLEGNMQQTVAMWRAQSSEPVGPTELLVVAEALADSGDETALAYVERLRAFQPAEADALLARLRWRQGRFEEATDALQAAFRRFQQDPWPSHSLMSRALDQVQGMAANNRASAARLYEVLQTPFSALVLNDKRVAILTNLSMAYMDFRAVCAQAFASMEPHVPWQRDFLAARLRCYAATNNPLKTQARDDLDAFMKAEPMQFASDL